MKISFSPPDITAVEIQEVVDTLHSGWITTGPKTKLFERQIAAYCGTEKAACLNSATAGMELVLRLLGVGEGDEVITTAYTYTASASVICHVGAKIVLVDTAENSYEMDYDQLEKVITEKTKVIISVDLAGMMCDYDRIFEIVNAKKALFQAANPRQEAFGRVVVLADAAHSFGASYKEQISGSVADFSSFSFHAVKNLTTGEGGAVTWREIEGISSKEIYQQFMLFSLHGQSKDALEKTVLGAWEYDVLLPAYKCNMTDITASLGIGQLKRFPTILQRRKEMIKRYDAALVNENVSVLRHYEDHHISNGHLYFVQLLGKDEAFRNNVIEEMAHKGIATNVHYKPLPLLTAYKNLGLRMTDYPHAFKMYQSEITLPLHTLLKDEELDYVAESFKSILKG